MKKILILLTAFLFCFTVSAFGAGPYLKTQAQPGASKWKVSFLKVNGKSSDLVFESNPVNDALKADISTWPLGKIEAAVQAGGAYVLNGVEQAGTWRWSDPVPFELIIPNLVTPTVDRLIE